MLELLRFYFTSIFDLIHSLEESQVQKPSTDQWYGREAPAEGVSDVPVGPHQG